MKKKIILLLIILIFSLSLVLVTGARQYPEFEHANIDKIQRAIDVIYQNASLPTDNVTIDIEKQSYRCLDDCILKVSYNNDLFVHPTNSTFDVFLETPSNLNYHAIKKRNSIANEKGVREEFEVRVEVPIGQQAEKFNVTLLRDGELLVLDPEISSGCTDLGDVTECTGQITGNSLSTADNIWIHDAVIDGTAGYYITLNSTNGWINFTGNVTLSSGGGSPSHVTIYAKENIEGQYLIINNGGSNTGGDSFCNITASKIDFKHSSINCYGGSASSGNGDGGSGELYISQNLTTHNTSFSSSGGSSSWYATPNQPGNAGSGYMKINNLITVNSSSFSANGGTGYSTGDCGQGTGGTGGSAQLYVYNDEGLDFDCNGLCTLNAYGGNGGFTENGGNGGIGQFHINASTIKFDNNLGKNTIGYDGGEAGGCPGSQRGASYLTIRYGDLLGFKNTSLIGTGTGTRTITSYDTDFAKIGFFNNSDINGGVNTTTYNCQATAVFTYGNDSSVTAPEPQINFTPCAGYSSVQYVSANTFFSEDIITVTINSPVDNFFSQQNLTANITVESSLGNLFDNVSIYLNGTINQTSFNVPNGTTFNLNTTMYDGTWTWYIEACSNSTQAGTLCKTTTARTFTKDSTNPVINFYTPTASGDVSVNNLTTNIVVEDTDLESVNYSVYYSNGTYFYSNYTASASSPYTIADKVNFIFDDNYTINVTVNDTSNNIISQVSYYYYDNEAPSINISEPTGTVSSYSNSLVSTFSDTSSLTCYYWITDNNLNMEVSPSTYDCSSAGFVVSSDGLYIAFANATDGKFVTESNSSFTVDTTIPAPATGGGGGGGGSSFSGTTLALLDFGTPSLSITVIAPPSTTTRDLRISNEGTDAIRNAQIQVSSSLQQYLLVEFCDIDKSSCSNVVNLEQGESGFLVITGDFPATFGDGTQGIIKVVASETFELPVSIDRLPLYKYVDPMINWLSERTGFSKPVSAGIIFIMIIGVGVLIASQTLRGG